jgi:hypothetical protein
MSVRCQPGLGRDRDAPGALEPAARDRIRDVLKAGELVRQRAHVAAALDVVLTAQRVQAGAPPPDLTGEERQVDEGQHVVDGVGVLGDAQGPADHRAIGAGVGVGHRGDVVGRDPGQGRHAVERIVGEDVIAVGREAGGGAGDEGVVLEPGGQDRVGDAVGQGDVGADRQRQGGDRPRPPTRCGADRSRTGGRRGARPSARGGRRSGGSRARSSPTRGGRRCPPPRGTSWCRHQPRRPSPDRRR